MPRAIQPFRVTLQPGRSSRFESLEHYPYKYTKTYITFADGTTFIYRGIPTSLFEEWVGARSMGKFYDDFVRGKYDSVKQAA